jgi:hypothetical protein
VIGKIGVLLHKHCTNFYKRLIYLRLVRAVIRRMEPPPAPMKPNTLKRKVDEVIPPPPAPMKGYIERYDPDTNTWYRRKL